MSEDDKQKAASMPTATESDPSRDLLDRVRSLQPDQVSREVRMFGVLALMVDDAMTVAAHKNGSLLVRVDPAEDADLVQKPGAARAEMGTGRSMGEGWIRVDGSVLGSDATLEAWLDAAMRYHRKGN